MRSRRTHAFTVGDILHGINQERDEQYEAQLAALSCSVALTSIRKGIQNHIINNRKRPKTKYEYNQERVRDFRIGKSDPTQPPAVELVADDLETYGKASYFLLQTDPSPFVRNYEHSIFKQTLQLLHPQHPHARSILKVDLSDQLIGHDRFVELCDAIARSSVKYLNISGNKLTNDSMKSLSTVLRSLHHLVDLNVSRNRVGDEGIGYLLSDSCYPATMKVFNCTYKTLNAASALHIGHMFKQERNCALEILIVGGKVGIKGWGDEFMRVLTCCIVEYGLKKLKTLTIADAGLSEIGLNCISTILSCDEASLEYLNISKNEFSSSISRTLFIGALRLNKTLREVTIRGDGFTEIQSAHVVSIVRSNYRDSEMNRALAGHSAAHRQHLEGEYQLTWPERVALATCVAGTYNACRHSYHRARILQMKDTPWKMTGPPQWQVAKQTGFDSSLLTNIAAMFSDTQVVLPVSVRNALEQTNAELQRADLLLEALMVSKTMAVDPSRARGNHSSKDNHRVIGAAVEETCALVSRVETALHTYTAMCKDAQARLFEEIETFRTDSEAVLRVAKRRERKNIHVVIQEVSQRMNADRLQMCVEDYRTAVSEESQALEQAVGALHRQKLLHFCLTQENTGHAAKTFDFTAFVRNSLPYFSNLGLAATFAHYFYLTFPTERKNNKVLESKALMQLGMQLGAVASEEDSETTGESGTQPSPLPDVKPLPQEAGRKSVDKRRTNVMMYTKRRTISAT
jgi:Ran GTPase-activating protein (RanGAP) involved in mRNA processing and transport